MSPLPHQPAGQSRAEWHSMLEADDPCEPLPTVLNTVDHPRFLQVGKDKRTVRYVGKGNHSQDVGAIRCAAPGRAPRAPRTHTRTHGKHARTPTHLTHSLTHTHAHGTPRHLF